MATDLEIARAVPLRPIAKIAESVDIPEWALIPFGRHIAKVDLDYLATLAERPDGALVLVTGITPTPAGEGKTTTAIGLGDALNMIGWRAAIALREPSLGPCFGRKGGATGGGYAQVLPMEQINLHFTGDIHAVTAAHNLLAAMVDNHLYWGNAIGLDRHRITWRRALDMNDRSLRRIVCNIEDSRTGTEWESGFDITAASEVMAVLCLAQNLADLQARLGRIIVGERHDGALVTAADLRAEGAMAVLLRDALAPNLVQTIAGTPAFVHGGPFANIAHGCNSVVATRLALKCADIVVTEAGFGADLGAEKFFHITCCQAGFTPSAVVIVATIRALKIHGGIAKNDLAREDVAAVERGLVNLFRHVENVRKFGLPAVVALNRHDTDTEAEIAALRQAVRMIGSEAVVCNHWAEGGQGAIGLAQAVVDLIRQGKPAFRPLYARHLPPAEKISIVAREIYRARDVTIPPPMANRLHRFAASGFAELPVCIAKTPYSLSADPSQAGAPEGHSLPVREVRLAAGAGFIIVLCAEIATMPGLPRAPAAERIRLGPTGRIEGLA